MYYSNVAYLLQKNELKVFGKLHLNLLGFIIWTISMFSIVYFKS